jgi:hypothetical protein
MIFKGRKLLIATMHGKERVIAPVFQRLLGAKPTCSAAFDTDKFGTFSGEIERTADALTTVRNKCLEAMEGTNCEMCIASEGSFGAHPQLLFAAANEEILMFIDKKYDLEISVREVSLETNFNSRKISSWDELLTFATAAQFPSHALILQKAQHDFLNLVKGIADEQTLFNAYLKLKDSEGNVYVSTDMRAMYNPSRMKVIAKAATRLAERICAQCPSCGTHGYGLTSSKAGLPCQYCGLPTKSTLVHIHSCVKCGYSEEIKYPLGKLSEEPTYCDFCNP